MAGALQNPVDAGVFVFKDCDEAYVRAFVAGPCPLASRSTSTPTRFVPRP
jgi:hypothetical protein